MSPEDGIRRSSTTSHLDQPAVFRRLHRVTPSLCSRGQSGDVTQSDLAGRHRRQVTGPFRPRRLVLVLVLEFVLVERLVVDLLVEIIGGVRACGALIRRSALGRHEIISSLGFLPHDRRSALTGDPAEILAITRTGPAEVRTTVSAAGQVRTVTLAGSADPRTITPANLARARMIVSAAPGRVPHDHPGGSAGVHAWSPGGPGWSSSGRGSAPPAVGLLLGDLAARPGLLHLLQLTPDRRGSRICKLDLFLYELAEPDHARGAA